MSAMLAAHKSYIHVHDLRIQLIQQMASQIKEVAQEHRLLRTALEELAGHVFGGPMIVSLASTWCACA